LILRLPTRILREEVVETNLLLEDGRQVEIVIGDKGVFRISGTDEILWSRDPAAPHKP
jgi:hypothetical protein